MAKYQIHIDAVDNNEDWGDDDNIETLSVTAEGDNAEAAEERVNKELYDDKEFSTVDADFEPKDYEEYFVWSASEKDLLQEF